jgi:hypothetical protein
MSSFKAATLFNVRFETRTLGDGSKAMRVYRVGLGQEKLVCVHSSNSDWYLNKIKETYSHHYGQCVDG